MTDETIRICFIEGCDEPAFKHFARCHHHQKCEWRKHKNNANAQARGSKPKNACSVQGCNEPRYSTASYCREHQLEYQATRRAEQKAKKIDEGKPTRKYTPRKPVLYPADDGAIGQIGDYPRLLVVDTQEQKYVEYAPVREVRAQSTRSLKGVGDVLSKRGGWIVVKAKRDA
jgi:hypothetical protein